MSGLGACSAVHTHPHCQAIALEPRILFDAAAATAAVEHLASDHPASEQSSHADAASPVPATPAPALPASRALAGTDATQAAAAAPTVTLSSTGADVLLGEQFSFTVSFSNASSQEGYAPFVTLLMPASGKDGDDGASFVSATYLGGTLSAKLVTFDAAGQAVSPVAKDISGNFVTLDAADFGMRPGDQLVILQLPFASMSADQPPLAVQVTARLSNLADSAFSDGAPDLTLRAGGGFELGNDALDNPTNDPSLIEAGTVPFVIHPTVITFTHSLDLAEGETATGPNYGHTLTLTATPAPGQALSNIDITQPLPDNVQVTAINPGSGGSLTSITLADGTRVTDPAAIATQIGADAVFISAFTVHYASLTGPTAALVSFYVPQQDGNGQQVLDPVSGAPATITLDAPVGQGDWVPLDSRDLMAPATAIHFSASGDSLAFVAKSLTLHKQATLLSDLGQSGLSPGDSLDYRLQLALSDYFAFGADFFADGQLLIHDTLGDGQTLSAAPTLTVTLDGVAQTIALVSTTAVNADGSTALVFDLAASLQAASSGVRGWLNGDLAFDADLQGAVLAVISYSTLVSQRYTAPAGSPHGAINEGDAVGNAASVEGSLLQDLFNLTGQTVTDASSTSSTLPTHTVDIQLVAVNAGAPPANGELRPGDVVTFELGYPLLTGDYQDFVLSAYLPLPLFDVSAISWSNGSGPGQWQLAPDNSNLGALPSVTSGPGNAVLFSFPDYSTEAIAGSQLAVRFTLVVGDQPFADQRSLDVLGQSSQRTTLTAQTLTSSAVAPIVSVAEPSLAIVHGVVAASHGSVTGIAGSWQPPGSSGVPFAGSITELSQVDGNVVDLDGADHLRLVTAIENSGGGGAFDTRTEVVLPSGLDFVGGSLASANLLVYRGDGTALRPGIDYSVVGTQIDFLDAGGQASLQAGRAGSAADASGANVLVISYDVQASASSVAGSTWQSSAVLGHYASVEGGSDFTPIDPLDNATQQVAAPRISKTFAGGAVDASDSSAAHTSDSDLVIGERMLYDIVVTLPEGTTQALRIDDLIPAGLHLDSGFNGGLGYQLILTRAGSAALTADFVGTLLVSGASAIGGSLGGDGVDARMTFSSAEATADNLSGNDSFVVRVQLIASNVASNQAGQVLSNDAQLLYSDPDGDVANSAAAIDRSVAASGGAPAVSLREPTLQVLQTVTSTTPPLGYDEGDAFELTLTLVNGSAASDFDAFEISLQDRLPTALSNLSLASVLYQNGASNHGGADFEIVDGQLRSVGGANIDIAKGASIVLRISGTVNASAASASVFSNQASLQWTSLDGASADERSGVDGPLNSGALNDYRSDSSLDVGVAQAMRLSRVGGLADTAAPTPTTAAIEQVGIGELIRYRLVVLVPEGSNPGYQLQVTLANGLQFIDADAAANPLRVAFISGGGLSSDVNLVTAGTLDVVGNQNSPEAGPITADLSGAAPTGVLDPARVSVLTQADGSQLVTFDLGNITNGSGSDADLEGITLEFNVRVANQLSNGAAVQLPVSAVEVVNGNSRAHSDTLFEQLLEPSFAALDKHISAFDANPTGTRGSATVTLGFTHNGGLAAYDTQLRDGFAEGSDYQLLSVQIDGIDYAAGSLPAGVGYSLVAGLQVDFARLEVGSRVEVSYSVSLPNDRVIASSAANLTWSSLPEDFKQWGGSSVGVDGDLSGERTGSGGGANHYHLAASAGLGIISGTLWNDSASATASTTVDGAGLAGQNVTLTWAGADGLLATSADNLQFSAQTDASGHYRFGVLPSGVLRIDTPPGPLSYPPPLGQLRVRIDTDGAVLGQIDINLADATGASADAGYVEGNEGPVNQLPGPLSGQEDVTLAISGIHVSDIDADRDPDSAGRSLQVTLNVLHGTLALGAVPGGVTQSGQNTPSLILTGTQADLDVALASLQYLGERDYNGADTLTVASNDLGNFGDVDGDGLPGGPGDALSDTDSVAITLAAVDDPPQGNPDSIIAVEAGGTQNGTPGLDPIANLLANDSDVDIASNQDALTVIRVTSAATGAAVNLPNIGASTLQGQFGRLRVASNGTYQYLIDNDNPAVQALRVPGQTLVEQFSYRLRDQFGVQSGASLSVTLRGANDTPLGVDDQGLALAAGSGANASPGAAGDGEVLPNDTDVDSGANGETAHVTGIRPVAEAAIAPLVAVPLGGAATVLGLYGTLTIDSAGHYHYLVDSANPVVRQLPSGAQLQEWFSYRLTDAAGLNDVAQLLMTVQGANDPPLASDDSATAMEAGGSFNDLPGVDPAGNLLSNDGDTDASDSKTLSAIGLGSEASGGALLAVVTNQTLRGLYGTLSVAADGSYSYQLDNTLAAVQALTPGATLTELFTYQQSDDAGATDTAQLTLNIQGAWDAPVASDDVAVAVTDDGSGNSVNPTRNVLPNDSDVDQGDSLQVSGIRAGAEAGASVPENVAPTTDTLVAGLYGSLLMAADGTFTYRVDSSNPEVIALGPLQFLQERFSYRVRDQGGLDDVGEIRITLRGRNETPLASPDAADALEAGGLANAEPGLDPIGNVIDNDSDADGDLLHLSAIATTGGATGVLGSALRGQYGELLINADGSWQYRVDNALAAVQALRSQAQTLSEAFVYTVADVWGASRQSQLTLTVHGRNDTPVAAADNAVAVEAGGIANATPGSDARGNVLDNDSDVDTPANGESQQVLEVVNQTGQSVAPGQPLVGQYGQLTLDADGEYRYVIDNRNPAVEALRSRDDSLGERFRYQLRDTDGAISSAELSVLIQGSDDAPLARDDSAVASDQVAPPHASGTVLANDSDIDRGDALQVIDVRTEAPEQAGTHGTVGQALSGRYGRMTLDADGQYRYDIDLDNPQVLAAAGLGQVLDELFTYRISDLAGAVAEARLLIHLDISAPYIAPPAGAQQRLTGEPVSRWLAPDPQPAVFVTPVVERAAQALTLSSWGAGGSNLWLALPAQRQADSLGAGLGLVPGQWVAQSVGDSRLQSDLDLAWILGRQSRTELSADGLLSDPSLFASSARDMTHNPAHDLPEPTPAPAASFSAQLRAAAQRLAPMQWPGLEWPDLGWPGLVWPGLPPAPPR